MASQTGGTDVITSTIYGLHITNTATKGRGVVTSKAIPKGKVVEQSVCIVVSHRDYTEYVRHSIFEEYLFKGYQGEHLLALGIGSLFNHSTQPNLDYNVDKHEKVVTFKAARNIGSGEELTFYYGDSIWFQNAEVTKSTRESCEHDHMDDEKLFLASIDI